MSSPQNMEMLGSCGGIAPGLLPLLVGEPVDRCPTALGLQDAEVLELAVLVPSPESEGLLGDEPLIHLPPKHREAMRLARAWLKAWKGKANE